MDEESFPVPPNLPVGVPEELIPTLEDLRNEFLTEKPFLKCVTNCFVEELKKGWIPGHRVVVDHQSSANME